MRRGELWTDSGGVYSRKPRPVLIIQDDLYATEYSVIVLPISIVLRSAGLARYRLSTNPINGLRQDSDVQIDKITTLRRDHLTERIGTVGERDLREIERLILPILGMGR
ncbi:MAG: type II toxin-antitoxin system PemK/MazF family toxin [Nesterenkonia sp.]